MRCCIHHALLAATTFSLVGGCGGGGANNQPSYADLVVTYNAELETLDRLERQRSELIAEYQRQLQPNMEDAAQAIADMLNSAVDQDPQGAGGPLTPDQELDRAVASAERTGQATSELLEAALQSTQDADAELTPEQAAIKDEFEQKLADLDEQIEAQKARAERARAARDAAEP